MKILFWFLLAVVTVVVVALFVSLISGLRRRRVGEERGALPSPEWRVTPPLEGRQAELFRQLIEVRPEWRVLADVPYARFLSGDSLSGSAPILVCDEHLMPLTVVIWGEVAVPEAVLAAAGVALWRIDSEQTLQRLLNP